MCKKGQTLSGIVAKYLWKRKFYEFRERIVYKRLTIKT